MNKKKREAESSSDDSDGESENSEEVSDSESQSAEDESDDQEVQPQSNLPLYKRLAEQNSDESVSVVARERLKRRRLLESSKGFNIVEQHYRTWHS